MSIYLHKILPLIVSPMGLVLFLILLGLIRRRFFPIFVAFVVLIVASLQVVSTALLAYLEEDHPPITLTDVPAQNAIVVLGGVTTTIQNVDGSARYEFNQAVDRVDAGLTLTRLGTAPTLVLTRGQLPWSMGRPEGEFLSDVAIERGIEPDRILLTDPAANTAQEAVNVAQILPKGARIGLVTSAFHMPRAQPLFEDQGLIVTPVPVDHRAIHRASTPMDYIPSAKGFYETSFVMREMIGRLYYELRR